MSHQIIIIGRPQDEGEEVHDSRLTGTVTIQISGEGLSKRRIALARFVQRQDRFEPDSVLNQHLNKERCLRQNGE